MTVEFHGTPDEAEALQIALGRNCSCQYDGGGFRVETCAPHRALIEDQRFVDHMLFARRTADKLLREEGLES